MLSFELGILCGDDIVKDFSINTPIISTNDNEFITHFTRIVHSLRGGLRVSLVVFALLLVDMRGRVLSYWRRIIKIAVIILLAEIFIDVLFAISMVSFYKYMGNAYYVWNCYGLSLLVTELVNETYFVIQMYVILLISYALRECKMSVLLMWFFVLFLIYWYYPVISINPFASPISVYHLVTHLLFTILIVLTMLYSYKATYGSLAWKREISMKQTINLRQKLVLAFAVFLFVTTLGYTEVLVPGVWPNLPWPERNYYSVHVEFYGIYIGKPNEHIIAGNIAEHKILTLGVILVFGGLAMLLLRDNRQKTIRENRVDDG